jgi:hypothetical protein
MSSDHNPFGALDKMLLSPSPSEKKEPKAMKNQFSRKSNIKLPERETVSPPSIDRSSRPARSTSPVDPPSQSIDPTNLLDQSGQPTQSTHQLVGAVVKRPLAFYIPESINEKIEEALRYYQQKYNKKIDRSAIVSALLGDATIWDRPALDKLADKVLEQLKNRLNERLSDQLNQSTS